MVLLPRQVRLRSNHAAGAWANESSVAIRPATASPDRRLLRRFDERCASMADAAHDRQLCVKLRRAYVGPQDGAV